MRRRTAPLFHEPESLLLQCRKDPIHPAFQGPQGERSPGPEVYDASPLQQIDRPFGVPAPGRGTASPMNRLAAILPLGNVLVNVDATSKKRVFEQAGLLFENQHSIARGTVTDNLFARERLGSTGLGHGVAIPHGRVKGLKNPLAAVVRLTAAIGFDAPDDEPVMLLIFLLVPEAATQRHLEILSEIAEMLSDRELRERLKTEPEAAAVHKLISDWEPLKSVA
jgi:PTS system nitrogen regulatory IIA component